MSLQGMRALAFIGIFSEHAGLTHLGSWGVSCFLLLSGFLMYYNYGDDTDDKQLYFGDNIKYAIKKIGKLYPLHCCTLAVAFFVYYDQQRLDNLRHIAIQVIKFILNLFLMQSWLPKAEFYWSFNAVAWYLSTQLVLYMAFPYIKKLINKGGKKFDEISVWGVLLAQILLSAVLFYEQDLIARIPITISDNLTFYITYICPLYRLGDFYLGCMTGYFFVHKRHCLAKHTMIASLIEGLAILLIYPLQLIYNSQMKIISNDAFRNDLLYIFPALLLVYMCAMSEGVVTKYILSSKLLVEIGNISGYAFLIHQLVIVVVRKLCGVTGPNLEIAFVSFLLTIGMSYLWIYGNNKIEDLIKYVHGRKVNE